MKAKFATTIFTLATASALAAVAGINAPGTPTSDYPQGHIASTQVRLSAARASAALHKSIGAAGLEPASAGFHILRPKLSEMQYYVDSSTSLAGGPIRFTPVNVIYPNEYLDPVGFAHGTVFASEERAFPNGAATLRAQQVGGTWSVIATFSQRGLNFLEQRHGAISSPQNFHDWFGSYIVPGETATEMRATLAVRGTALLPISITTLIQSSGSVDVTVADELTRQDAEAIVAAYSAS